MIDRNTARPSLRELIEGEGIEIQDYNVVANSTELVNRELIDLLSRELQGKENGFVHLVSGDGEPVVIYRRPQILFKKSEETGKKVRKTTEYYRVGFVGLSPYGLFAIDFSYTTFSEEQLEGLLSDDTIFPSWHGYFPRVGDVLKGFNQETRRSDDTTFYLTLPKFEDHPVSKIPTIVLKQHVEWEPDPETTLTVIPLQTEKGLVLWNTVLDDYVQRLQKSKELNLKLADANEALLNSVSKGQNEGQ